MKVATQLWRARVTQKFTPPSLCFFFLFVLEYLCLHSTTPSFDQTYHALTITPSTP